MNSPQGQPMYMGKPLPPEFKSPTLGPPKHTNSVVQWTIKDALAIIRAWQPAAHKAGFHLALAGSVLNQGYSFNDLDIIIMDMDPERYNILKAFMELVQDSFYLSGVKQLAKENPHYSISPTRLLFEAQTSLIGRKVNFFVYPY